MDGLPLVSVVVTTRNEERNIENCLRAIRLQTYPRDRVELIVIDNFSEDRTAELALKYTERVHSLGPERSRQRNFGLLEAASGELGLFLDADMILAPRTLECAVQKVLTEGLVGVYIPEIVLGRGRWGRLRRFERSFYDGTVVDCVRLVRISTVREFGGFNEKMVAAEDWDLDKELRKRGQVAVLCRYDFDEIESRMQEVGAADVIGQLESFWRRHPLLYHNEMEIDLKRYLRKKAYYSGNINHYVEKWGRHDPDVSRQLGLYYRFVGVFVERNGWRKLIAHPWLTLNMYVLKVLLGLIYLRRRKQ